MAKEFVIILRTLVGRDLDKVDQSKMVGSRWIGKRERDQ